MARILVIEDNPADLDLMSYLLESGGHQVIQAHGGEEGVGAAVTSHPDLVLCDIRMPDMDGFDVLRQISATTRIPVVAVTVLTSLGDRRIVLDAGFQGHMPKPIEPTGLLAEIADYLRSPGKPSCH